MSIVSGRFFHLLWRCFELPFQHCLVCFFTVRVWTAWGTFPLIVRGLYYIHQFLWQKGCTVLLPFHCYICFKLNNSCITGYSRARGEPTLRKSFSSSIFRKSLQCGRLTILQLRISIAGTTTPAQDVINDWLDGCCALWKDVLRMLFRNSSIVDS